MDFANFGSSSALGGTLDVILAESSRGVLALGRRRPGGEIDLDIELRNAARLCRIEAASRLILPGDGELSLSNLWRLDGREAMMIHLTLCNCGTEEARG